MVRCYIACALLVMTLLVVVVLAVTLSAVLAVSLSDMTLLLVPVARWCIL